MQRMKAINSSYTVGLWVSYHSGKEESAALKIRVKGGSEVPMLLKEEAAETMKGIKKMTSTAENVTTIRAMELLIISHLF